MLINSLYWCYDLLFFVVIMVSLRMVFFGLFSKFIDKIEFKFWFYFIKIDKVYLINKYINWVFVFFYRINVIGSVFYSKYYILNVIVKWVLIKKVCVYFYNYNG